MDLTDFAGEKVYALYSTFKVGNESSKYELTVSGYSGTAGMHGSYTGQNKLRIMIYKLFILQHITIYFIIAI
jgi:hypothetical protein